ncbi:UNVERIFIED_CONTAM: Premnaspirodiene oxygenase [Sesamum latifolium]|uniref:Premnaspirodiene oxygenase n=1 Tax=Sesamum latifolium TaxID=2727402 RepID=A0AAW2TCI8_9LAMI
MEFGFFSFIVFLSFLVLILVIRKLTTFSKTCKPKLNLPPGPRNLPFIGSLHLFAGSNPPHRTLRDLAKKYGPLMHLQLGEVNIIVASSSETAQQFLKTHDIDFASRSTLLMSEICCYGNKDIVFAPHGEYWREMRKICTLELLSAKRVESFRPIREKEISDLCRWIVLQEGSPINLTQKISMTNFEIMARATFGKKTEEHVKFIAIVKEGMEFMSTFHVADVYPSIKLLSSITGLKRKVEKVHRETDRIIENIIEEHRRVDAADRGNHEDLADVLLRVWDSGSLDLPLTIENIKAVLADMFGGGIEAPTTTIDWAMAEMLKNPSVLIKAQDEVRQVFDGKCCVNEAYFDELKYLKLVIKETLRLHPPGALTLPRESKERSEINGYEIPARTRVLVNMWAIGRDPEYWEDAESFKPERFLKKQVDFRGNCLEFIPFGAGRRICPGISFAIAQVELALAMFLYHFDWILPNGMKPEEMDMTEFSGVSARRNTNLYIIPIVRRPFSS